MEAARESRQTCKCYITFSFGIKQTDITDDYRDRMKNLNSGNPPLKADGEQGDGNEPTAQHEKMSQKKYKFICLMRHIVYSAIFFLAVNDNIRDCRRPVSKEKTPAERQFALPSQIPFEQPWRIAL